MIDDDCEINYAVRCRMGSDDNFHVVGYARTEEHLREMLDRLRETWRYVTYNCYRARKPVEQPTKRKAKK